MTLHTRAYHNRLQAIDPLLAPPAHIKAAEDAGRGRCAAEPAGFPAYCLGRARHHPVLGFAAALAAYESLSQPDRKAYAALGMGIGLCWWGQYGTGLTMLDEAAARLKAVEDQRADLYVSWHRLLCQRRLTTIPNAPQQIIELADDLRAQGDHLAVYRCYTDTAGSLAQVKGRAASAALLSQAEAYFKQHEHWADLAILQAVQGYLAYDQGDTQIGDAYIAQAEDIAQEIRMPALLSLLWLQRGRRAKLRRDGETAIRWLRQALQQAEGLDHHYYVMQTTLELFDLRFVQGDYHRCEDLLASIRDLVAASGMEGMQAVVHLSDGHLRLYHGELDAARTQYQQARQLYAALGNQLYVHVCDTNLAVVARRANNFSLSLRLLQAALAHFQQEGVAEFITAAHHNLGKTYAAFGYVEPAIRHLQRGIDTATDAHYDFMTAQVEAYLARLLARHDPSAEPVAWLERIASRAVEQNMSHTLVTSQRVLGDVLLLRDQPALALLSYQSAYQKADELALYQLCREIRVGIAEAYLAMGQVAAARRTLALLPDDALTSGLRWQRHTLQARIAEQSGALDDALRAYTAALTKFRSARRTLDQEIHVEQFALSLRPVYERALQLAITQNAPAEGLQIAELFGAQLLHMRQGQPITQQADDTPDDLLPTLTETLNAQLGTDWTVLRYAWGTDTLHLFAITPQGMQHHPIAIDYPLVPSLYVCAGPGDSFRQNVYDRAPEAESQTRGQRARRKVYPQLLPRSVRQRLHPDHTLIVIPSNWLYGLPFQALLDGTEPLIMRTRLVYAQSLAVLLASLTRQSRPVTQDGAGLIIAHTQFDDATYEALAYVPDEISQIQQQASSDIHTLVDDEQAHATVMNMAGRGQLAALDWLHIATHGFVDRATGTYLGVMLGDEVLHVDEIDEWQLAARVVTLTACQAGLGRWYYGDDLTGLMQAFLGAGAQSVVASLWRVADNASIPALMGHYYSALARGATPSAALAGAQREAVRAGVPSYYWAPFCAFGRP